MNAREEDVSHLPHCPTCGRPFKRILEYPSVRVLSFERLPLPEAIDEMSRAAWLRRAERLKDTPLDVAALHSGGINMTPAIERACSAADVQDYFTRLESLVGREVSPQQLLPPIPAHGYFKWAHPVVGTGIYLSLGKNQVGEHGEPFVDVEVHCDGMNMGSAGGPTLQPLGSVARLSYQGLLSHGQPTI
jgi:hypothetical protein